MQVQNVIQIMHKASLILETLRISQFMKRQQTSDLYKREVEQKLIKDVAIIGGVFITICTVVILLGSQSSINKQLQLWQSLLDEQATMKIDQLNQIISAYQHFLNKTDSVFSQIEQSKCEFLNTCTFSDVMQQVWQMQITQKLKIFKNITPDIFYYSDEKQTLTNVTNKPFSEDKLSDSNQFVIKLKILIKSSTFPSYYYLTWGNDFVMCMKNFRFVTLPFTFFCVVIKDTLFIKEQNHIDYSIYFGNQNFEDNLTLQGKINAKKQELHENQLFNCEGLEVSEEFQYCLSIYLKKRYGIMKCYLSSFAIRSLPYITVGKFISLPIYSDQQKPYFVPMQNINEKIEIFVFPKKSTYNQINEKINQIDKQIFFLCQYTLYAVVLYSLLIRLNRLYIRKRLISTIEELSEKRLDEVSGSNTFEQFQQLADMNKRYEWMKRILSSESNKIKILEEGLEIFSRNISEYNQVIEYIYNELIYQTEMTESYKKSLQYYDELINLQLNRLQKCSQLKVDMDIINQIYRLQIRKANVYCQYLMKKPKQSQVEELVFHDRLDQFEQTFDIDQDLFDLSTLVKCKIRSVLGKSVSYRRLLQLEKSDNEDVRSQAYFITALELSKKSPQFDIDLVYILCNGLLECNTSSDFKRQCLTMLAKIMKRNGMHQSLIAEVQNMASYYCSNFKHFYILIESYDGLDERLVRKILLRMVSYLKKNDVIQVMSLSEDFRNNGLIKRSDADAQNLLLRHLERISEQHQGSRRSRSSFIEKLVANFKRIMNISTTDQSKYIVIILSDGSYSDLRSQKDSIKKCHFPKLDIGNNYIHLILIGNNIKNESFQKSKLLKSLKIAQSFLQIDLKDCDTASNNEEIDIFFKEQGQ